jgi:hypothetical protein
MSVSKCAGCFSVMIYFIFITLSPILAYNKNANTHALREVPKLSQIVSTKKIYLLLWLSWTAELSGNAYKSITAFGFWLGPSVWYLWLFRYLIKHSNSWQKMVRWNVQVRNRGFTCLSYCHSGSSCTLHTWVCSRVS